jgi:uncharacterized protein YecE (DUF72 family)
MVRFHGRNAETWLKKGLASAAERFNYLYSDEELNELAPKVQALEEKAEKVRALFNNCHGDKGVKDATTFAQLIN